MFVVAEPQQRVNLGRFGKKLLVIQEEEDRDLVFQTVRKLHLSDTLF